MVFFIAYLFVRRLVRALVGNSSVAALEIENVVLRHQLAVLGRVVKRPSLQAELNNAPHRHGSETLSE